MFLITQKHILKANTRKRNVSLEQKSATPTHIFIAPGLSIRVEEFKITTRILRTLKSNNQVAVY